MNKKGIALSGGQRVAALIVTYNRLAPLQECLEALAGQTYPLAAIFVIDNASTDGTQEWFGQSAYSSMPQFRFLQLGENLGGAGGFEAGMREAMKGQFDWLLLLDDDSIAVPDMLERLLKSPDASDPSVGVLATKVIDVDGRLVEMNQQMTFDPYTADRHDIAEPLFEQASVDVDCTTFVGFMVRSSVVGAVGLPRGDFFIHFDDHEYSLRIKQQGFAIRLIPASVMVHKLKLMHKEDHEAIRIAPGDLWKHYYGQRNEIWGLPHFMSPWHRKLEFLARRGYWVFQRTIKYLGYDHRWLRIRIEWQAYFDALFGRLGKRIDPAEFKRKLSNV
jgi:GT2 family glycosyltransferase